MPAHPEPSLTPVGPFQGLPWAEPTTTEDLEMIDRRDFFRRTCGMATGLGVTAPRQGDPNERTARGEPAGPLDPALAEYERTLAAADRFELLGLPRSWWVVRQGFHPVAPERVVIVRPGTHDWSNDPRTRELRAALVQKVQRWRLHWDSTLAPGRDPEPLPGYWQVKLDTIFRIIDHLSTHYQAPEHFPVLARNMALREALGSTGIGRHLALLHDFQSGGTKSGPLATTNGLLDWWLFLFPEGVD